MSSVVINGDSSGSVTLQAPAAAGSTTITLPTISGGSFIVSDSSGNVGIGTSSPSYKLQVKGAVDNASTSIGISDSNGRTLLLESPFASGVSYIGNYATSVPFGFKINGSEVARFDSSGNLGIGTSSPAQKVDVLGSIAVRASTTGTNQDAVVLRAYNSDVTAYANAIYYGNSQKWCYAGSTVGASLDSSGNLLVGTTSAWASAARVLVSGASSDATMGIKVGTNGNYGIYFSNQSSTLAGGIVVNSGSVAYNTTSDYRLKENAQPMTGALEKVAALKPCTYTWKADGSEGQGFIAHELQAVVPDCVTGEKDAVDAEGNPIYQGIDTSFLVATLTAAIQELNAKVEAQAVQIAAQAAEIATLKGQA